MSIFTRLRDRRRNRIITKYLNSQGTGLTIRPKNTWIPHWLHPEEQRAYLRSGDEDLQ